MPFAGYDSHMSSGRRFIFLGTGTSVGVPMIGCDCDVCTSHNPRNHRTRPSVLLQVPGGNILIDCGPEMRLQLLREKIGLVHALLLTHYHADHLFGLDDVRVFPHRLGGPLPIYCELHTENAVRSTFAYAFEPWKEGIQGFVPKLAFKRIETEPFEVLGETITPIPLIHGHFHVLGFRIGDIAYCTDVSRIPPESMELLRDLDVLVLDALRPTRTHASHFTVEEALDVVDELQPKRTYFTHMSHDMDYERLVQELPPGVSPAHDGLQFEF